MKWIRRVGEQPWWGWKLLEEIFTGNECLNNLLVFLCSLQSTVCLMHNCAIPQKSVFSNLKGNSYLSICYLKHSYLLKLKKKQQTTNTVWMEYHNDAKNELIFYSSACLSNGNLQNEWASVPCCKLLLLCRGAIALPEIMPKPIIPRRQFCYEEVICYSKASTNRHIKSAHLETWQ